MKYHLFGDTWGMYTRVPDAFCGSYATLERCVAVYVVSPFENVYVWMADDTTGALYIMGEMGLRNNHEWGVKLEKVTIEDYPEHDQPYIFRGDE